MERRKAFSSLKERQKENRLNYIYNPSRQTNNVPHRNRNNVSHNVGSPGLSNVQHQGHSLSGHGGMENISSASYGPIFDLSHSNQVENSQSIEFENADYHSHNEELEGADIESNLENSLNNDYDNIDEIEDARQEFFNVEHSVGVEAMVPSSHDLESDIIRWAILYKIKLAALGGLLKLVRAHANDDFGSLPLDPRTLMKTPKSVEVVPLGVGEFTYYGLEKAIIEQLIAVGFTAFTDLIILFDLFADGIPIFKSRNLSLLALLGKIVHPRFKQPFFIAGYYGKEKAPNVLDFMMRFVIEYNQLVIYGLHFNGQHFKIKIRCAIADTVARNWWLEHPPHNANEGCQKCLVYGFQFNGTMTFPDLDAPLKNDENFRLSLPDPYRNKISPLELMRVKLFSDVPLEILHQGHLGVMKRLVKYWCTMFGGGVGALEVYDLFSEDYKALAKCVPLEFARKPRGFDELKYWKATEYRLLLNYLAPAAIRKFLAHHYIVHMNSLNCAMRILSDRDFCIILNSQADQLLRYFVENVETLYGRQHVVFCVHNAIHLAADVRRFEPLEEFSAYIFESYLGYLKSLVRCSSSPLSQLVKRLTEKNQVAQESNVNKDSGILVCDRKSKTDQTKLPRGFQNAHSCIKFPNFTLKDSYPNNFCYLVDGTIVSIDHICFQGNTPVILGHEFTDLLNLPDYPCDSSILGMYVVKDLSSDSQIWPIQLIRKKGFQIPVDDHYYMFPVMHSSHI